MLCVLLAQPLLGQTAPRWYRGNTHTHTINADGDASPDVVVRWYREHGYQFVVITEHEFLTDVAPLNGIFGAPGRFVVMSGQEVTQYVVDSAHPSGRRQAHVNGIGTTRVVMPLRDPAGRPARGVSVAESYARNIAAIRAAAGIAQINHPNWTWSVRVSDLVQLPDTLLFEIWNGQAGIQNLGGTDDAGNVAPSSESLWDSLLTRGKVVWGVASDDSHDFLRLEEGREKGPGRAWIMVRADTLTSDAIMTALARGAFYASTGVLLSDVAASDTAMTITIQRRGDNRYRTRFIGRGGRLLADVPGTRPRYRVRGDEGYVRAVITDSNGLLAWTQPVVLRK
jgi:hypothetical protein